MKGSLLILILFASQVAAQSEGNPENWCREGFFPRDSNDFTIGIVKGARSKRSYFHRDDKEKCPEGPGCRRASYVVGGDEVLINRSRNGYSCVWFPARKSVTVGWVKTSDLTVSDMLFDASPSAWLGEWVYADNGIEFTENKLAGFLNVTGNATWVGLNNNVHVGEIDGRYAPQNGVIDYADGDGEYDCRMTMRLIGRFLLVSDNLKCGGVNVSFTGVYRKKAARRP